MLGGFAMDPPRDRRTLQTHYTEIGGNANKTSVKPQSSFGAVVLYELELA